VINKSLSFWISPSRGRSKSLALTEKYFSKRKRFLRDFCAYRGVFGDGSSNAANRIFPQPTPVAMATKFGTKLAITR